MKTPRNAASTLLLDRLALAGLALVFAVHAWAVLSRAVDVPYWDEWEALAPGALQWEAPWSWIFSPQVESRTATTNLLVWLGYRIEGWNLIHQLAFNLGLYGLLVAGAAALCGPKGAGLPWRHAAPFLLFLLSPKCAESLFWGQSSNQHFPLLFFIMACLCLFRENPGPLWTAAGVAAAWISINSHASGFVACAALLAIPGLRILGRRGSGMGALGVAAGLGLWLIYYAPSPDHPQETGPGDPRFWRFFVNLVSWGFGMDQVSATLGLFCLALVLAPLVLKNKTWSSSDWAVAATAAGVLAALAAISFGRAGFGVSYSKMSRYAETAGLLAPLAAAGWGLRLRDSPSRPWALAALWIFTFLGHAGNWSFSAYDRYRKERLLGVACLEEHYLRGGPPNCPMIYPFPLGDKLKRAHELDVSFYRRIRAQTQ